MSKLWEHYGRHDPYYGVLSAPEFHADRMDAETFRRFFASGVQNVDAYLNMAEARFGPLTYNTALDYGCGVGRLSHRLAQRFQQVIAVDISESMLALARKNIDRPNVRYENAATMTSAPADFLLSLMVFQHIPPQEGLKIIGQLSARVRGTGIITLPVRDKASAVWRGLRASKRLIRAVLPWGAPPIPMYAYNEEDAIAALGERRVIVEHVDTPIFEYATLIFAAPAAASAKF